MVSSISGMQGFQGMQGMQRMGPPPGGMQGSRTLSDSEKKTVQDLLSNYDSENLTADDAKALFKSFEDAGIKGPGLRDAIEEAGFDADQVWSLAHDGQQPHSAPMGMRSGASANRIDTSAMQTLQSILNQYDLSNLSNDQEQSLIQQLNKAGLMQIGSAVDMEA